MLWIRKYINQTPSFNYFETHISTIEKTVETNPALCIETCKITKILYIMKVYAKQYLPIKISNTITMGNFKLW